LFEYYLRELISIYDRLVNDNVLLDDIILKS